MHDFRYAGNRLFCEGVSVETLARKFGTPLYVYSQRTLTEHFRNLDQALAPLDHRVCFAMKANSNLSVLRVLANLGSGFDIVSGGELQRVIAAGGNPRRCIFAGVGKTEAEIELALRRGIYSFNVESEPELLRINRIAARLKKIAPVAVRVNPGVDAHTHAKITTGTYENKFGIQFEQVEGVYARASKLKNLRLRGLQMHIGSQITQTSPFEQAVRKVLPLLQRLKEKYPLEFFSLGGGLGIVYQPALASGTAAWWKTAAAKTILTPQTLRRAAGAAAAPAGLENFDRAGPVHRRQRGHSRHARRIRETHGPEELCHCGRRDERLDSSGVLRRLPRNRAGHRAKAARMIKSDVVGPICESGDYFCKDRPLPKVGEGDYLALLSAGAYGFVMASNYNTRPLAAEILVNGRRAAVARERQPVKEIWSGEKVVAWLR